MESESMKAEKEAKDFQGYKVLLLQSRAETTKNKMGDMERSGGAPVKDVGMST
jgi:hypothetical protein